MTKKLVAICVGHSRTGDKGAVNVDNVTEWEFNQPLAKRVCELIRDAGHDCVVVSLYNGSGYSTAMNWLARHLKELKVDAAVELHFNSSDDSRANGYEFLHWFSSPKGLKLADELTRSFAKAFPQQKNRGLKQINAEDRGGVFLRKTHCPAVICEPFFGSNAKENAFFFSRREELARAYADGILNWLTSNALKATQ
jgi:N-acetylmuramoyl-L-alanine amidase